MFESYIAIKNAENDVKSQNFEIGTFALPLETQNGSKGMYASAR